jgi:putative endonuclease
VRTRAATGRRAEDAVADYLRADGYAILFSNMRLGALEIDLVARKDELVAVVEVRARGPGADQGALESVGLEKRRRLLRAVDRLWRTQLEAMPGVQRVRIDVAAVTFVGDETRVEYVEAAIQP